MPAFALGKKEEMLHEVSFALKQTETSWEILQAVVPTEGKGLWPAEGKGLWPGQPTALKQRRLMGTQRNWTIRGEANALKKEKDVS